MKSTTTGFFGAVLFACLATAACGGDDGESSGGVDARQQFDAGPTFDATPSSVQTVECAGATTVLDVTAPGNSYVFTPSNGNTISVNDIVKFTMPGSHNVVSNPSGQYSVGFGATKCLKFTAAGAFTFHCAPHGFTGTITVQ